MAQKKKNKVSDNNGCGCILIIILIVLTISGIYELYFWFTRKASKPSKIILIVFLTLILAAIVSFIIYKIIKVLDSKFHFLKKNVKSQDITIETNEITTRSLNTNEMLSAIDRMSSNGLEFEEFTVRLLSKNGFTNVRKTQGSGDYGVDVLAEKDGVSYAIQCKCYSDKVGNKAVQEAFSGKSYYNCMVAAVLTNNYFTKAAEETAKANNILLWDRNKLKEFLKVYSITDPKPDEKAKELFTSKLKDISNIIINTIKSNGIECRVQDIFPDSNGTMYELYCSDIINEPVISSIADNSCSPNAYLCESKEPGITKIYIEYPESMKLLYNNWMGIK